jgi:DNA-directed RNA polymerase subunit alpha
MNEREYRPLTIPRVTWDKQTIQKGYGQLVAQPLEPGFGITFGNALRRILLGGIEGAAVTSVIIEGVNNEFSVVPGVVEDVMQLCLNFKQIVVKSLNGKPGLMKLKVKGKSVVTVADIQTDHHLELINKDFVLAHLSANTTLEVDFFVEMGRGYQRAQWPEGKMLQADNKIYLDALFSPVIKVTFDVEKTRVGKEIDYDRLILHIHTNESENPLDVFHYAVSVMRSQLEHFLASTEIPFNEISKKPEPEVVKEPEETKEYFIKGIPVDLLLKSIDELELSVRAHNCLMNADIKRIIDLVNLNEDEGLKIKNFGRKSLNEVKDSMKTLGLSFGMNINKEELEKILKERGSSFATDHE